MNTIEELDIDYLITLIQEREIIWDKSNVDFKNKNLKTKAWEDISKVLFPDYENFTAERKNKVGEFTVQIFMFFILFKRAFKIFLHRQFRDQYKINISTL